MPRLIRKLTPYVPTVIRHNWITILSACAVLWLTWTIYEVRDLHHKDKHRITDIARESKDRDSAINSSRENSCKQTYQAFILVFRPFFPKDPKKWTQQQHDNWRQLTDTVSNLQSHCGKQVRPH